MTKINFVYVETYPNSLEQYMKRALESYVKKRPQDTLILNGTDGDVILDIKCRFVECVQKMKGTKVLYFPDNLDRFGDLFNKYEQHYDFIFFAHKNDNIGKPRYYHLPLAYDPDTHYQHKKDDTIYPLTKKHTVDVAFVGTKHDGRGFLTKVPNITIRGNGWADTIFPVYGALKAKLYSKTKIMINHHVAGDTSPNMRTFECLAMKTFMLTDLVPETLEAGMVQYKGQSDLEAKIAYYLEHEEEREAIAAKGYELVQPHTYEKRVEALMEVIENARLG